MLITSGLMMIKIIIYSDGYDSKNDKKMMKKKRLKINGTVLLFVLKTLKSKASDRHFSF